MTVIAGAIDLISRMFKLLSARRQQIQFLAAALGKNRMAGIAIVRLNAATIRRFMHAVMAAEAAQPILVADIVRIFVP